MNETFDRFMKDYGSDTHYTIGDMQSAYLAGQSASAARIAELEADNTILTERVNYLTDGMIQWSIDAAKVKELEADCKAMAEAVIESHEALHPYQHRFGCLSIPTERDQCCNCAKIYHSCPACIIAAKYREEP